MEEFNHKKDTDKDIIFSKTIKAGKRIYYIDVKKNKKEELYLAITESKKVLVGDADQGTVSFEKHKIFLYQEDFEHFLEGLHQAVDYIHEQGGDTPPRGENMEKVDIKLDIDF